jgi:hypothetical protein
MFTNRFVVLIAVFLASFYCRTVSAETLAQLTDPCDLPIPAEVDITSAWVERSGSTLTFVMTTRGTIPTSLPDPCSITYIWFVDADANPLTGQNPDTWGSEFNVRAVIDSSVNGYVDVVGSLPGNNNYGGVVTVTGNKIQLTIDLAQIGDPDLFTFRCDAGRDAGGSNGPTEQSPRAWISNYAFVYDNGRDPSFGADQNSVIFECSPVPFDPASSAEAAHDTYQYVDIWPQLHSQELIGNDVVLPSMAQDQKSGALGAEGKEYFTHSLCSADYAHLRNLSYMTIPYNEIGFSGQMQTKATAGATFRLIAKSGQTGPVPHGLYMLNIRHDYHLEAQAIPDGANGFSYAQVTITDITDSPDTQVFLWQDGRDINMDKVSYAKADTRDLADYGFHFERLYALDWALLDQLAASQPVSSAAITVDSTLTASVEVKLTGDMNNDGTVNFKDFALLAQNWLRQK